MEELPLIIQKAIQRRNWRIEHLNNALNNGQDDSYEYIWGLFQHSERIIEHTAYIRFYEVFIALADTYKPENYCGLAREILGLIPSTKTEGLTEAYTFFRDTKRELREGIFKSVRAFMQWVVVYEKEKGCYAVKRTVDCNISAYSHPSYIFSPNSETPKEYRIYFLETRKEAIFQALFLNRGLL